MASVKRSTFLLGVIASIALTSIVRAADPATAPAPMPAASANPVVVFKTSLGDIEITLDPKHAPITTANFLQYVDSKFYDGLIFHRVIPGFVVQGGGFTTEMAEKQTQAPITNEASNGLHNVRGAISMARTNDPNSATSQFFLNLVNNSDKLDPNGVSPEGYAVFGRITKGIEVIDKMAVVETATVGPYGDVPVKPIVIISARRK